MKKNMVMLALALVAIATALSAQQPADAPLLQQTDLTYVGAFRLPPNGASPEQSWGYGGTAAAVNPNGGSLFLVGHAWYEWIGELAVPAPLTGVLNQLNSATLIQPMAPGRANEFSVFDGLGNIDIGGMLVSNGELFMTAYATYDGAAAQAQSHFRRASTNLSQSVPLQGPYALANIMTGFVSGYITPIPSAWQSLLGGKALSGQCCISIISRTSFGPSATAFDPADIGVITPVPATTLLGYPQSQPTLGTNEESYALFNGSVRMAGAVFPAGSRSVLFFGRRGLGAYCYGAGTGDPALVGTLPPGEGAVEPYCYDPSDAAKGTHAYPYVHQVWAYDALELLAVKNGTKQRWQVLPYATWNFDLPFQSESRALSSVTYDPNLQRLYVVAAFGDGEKPLVHVFNVNTAVAIVDGSPSTAPIGTPVTATVSGPGYAGDWVGVFAVNSPNSNYLDWNYLNGTKTPPVSGLTSASFSLSMPTTPGQYEFRYVSGSAVLANSPPLTVTGATVSGAPTTQAVLNPVTATVAGPGNPGTWVGLYAVGSPNTTYLAWKYLNGTQTPPATGLTSANLQFAMPATPGQYDFRYFDGATPLGTSSAITVVAASVSGTPTTLPIGNPITASAAGPGRTSDWVGVYAVGSSNSSYLDWKYLNGTQTPPVSGLASASFPLTMPATPGNYQLRYFDGPYLIATSVTITVTAPTLSASPTTVPVGNTVTASAAGLGKPGDWVGVYAVGSPTSSYLNWRYLNGTQTPPVSGLTSASFPLNMPATPGNYQLRYFDGATLLATSATVTVTSPTVSASPTTVAIGSPVTASAAGPGRTGDWVGVYVLGSANSAYLNWKYLNGTQTPPVTGLTSASFPLNMPATPGQYQLRYFDGATLVASSATITVTGPTVVGTHGTMPIGFFNPATVAGPGYPGDWVGLYVVTTSNSSYLDWKYMNGTQTPPGTGIASAVLPFTMPMTAGQYEFRLFQGGSNALIATSPAFTVNSGG